MVVDSSKLRTTIESITDLPTLPTVVARITSQIGNPSTNAADIGKLIEQDQSLTSKVLRLVNSAYYGFPKQIKSIQHAVVILGFNKVKTIVVTASVFDVMRPSFSVGLDLKDYWRHSLGSAIASRLVAETLSGDHSAEDAFIGGLLHDIGKVVLDQFLPDLYMPVVKNARDKGILLLESEQEMLGITHSTVGQWIMEKWRLPPVIVNMVNMHHTPLQAVDRREMTAAVHIGDVLARALGIGNAGDERIPAIDPILAENYMIDESFLGKMVDRLAIEIAKAEEFFDLISVT